MLGIPTHTGATRAMVRLYTRFRFRLYTRLGRLHTRHRFVFGFAKF